MYVSTLDIGLPTYDAIPTGPKIIEGLFQGLAARASGFAIAPIANLAPALQWALYRMIHAQCFDLCSVRFLYVVMMYIAVCLLFRLSWLPIIHLTALTRCIPSVLTLWQFVTDKSEACSIYRLPWVYALPTCKLHFIRYGSVTFCWSQVSDMKRSLLASLKHRQTMKTKNRWASIKSSREASALADISGGICIVNYQ